MLGEAIIETTNDTMQNNIIWYMYLLIKALSNNIHIIPIIGKVTLKIFSKSTLSGRISANV